MIKVSLFFIVISLSYILMFKQAVSLVEFSSLYNILCEIKNIIPFNFINYEDSKEFISKIDTNNLEHMNLFQYR